MFGVLEASCMWVQALALPVAAARALACLQHTPVHLPPPPHPAHLATCASSTSRVAAVSATALCAPSSSLPQ